MRDRIPCSTSIEPTDRWWYTSSMAIPTIDTEVTGRTSAASLEQSTRHLLIRASAGSGKTFQLVNRYLMRLRDVGPDRILATTFTRKAAHEILGRILIRLAKAALSTDEWQRLAKFLGAEGTVVVPQRMLVELTRQLHRIRVGTLDSFMSKLASGFTLELGLSPGWRLLDDAEDQRLRALAVEDVVSDTDLLPLLHRLSKGQTERKVYELILETVGEFHQIFLTTDRAAWEKLNPPNPLAADRLRILLETLESFILGATYHPATVERDLNAFRDQDWGLFARAGLANRVLSGDAVFYSKPIPAPLVAIYEELIQHVAACEIDQWKQHSSALWSLLERFDRCYQRHKSAARGVNFFDLTLLLARLLRPTETTRRNLRQADDLAYRMDARIDHLLLDEFQDTSVSQWQVLRPFALACHNDDRSKRSFFCVGDIKQAIYGWRGGATELFGLLDQELPQLQTLYLNESRRSSGVVIETVNRVFSGLTRHPEAQDAADALFNWQKAFPQHRTVHADQPGHITLETGPVDETEPGEIKTAAALLAFAAERVAQWQAESPANSMAVLCCTNARVSEMVYELQRRGIAASEEGKSRLLDSAAAQLVQSAMIFADSPGDRIARFHVAQSPLGVESGFTDHDDDPAAEALAFRWRRQLLQDGYAATVHRWGQILWPACSARDRSRLRQVTALAGRYEAQASLRPGAFARFLEITRNEEAAGEGVRVMTIHQSKGLEFDRVILPELDRRLVLPPKFVTDIRPDGRVGHVLLYHDQARVRLLPPELREIFKQAHDRAVSESLNMLYVAMTRAARALHLIIDAPKQSSERLGLSWAGLLRATLAPDQIATPHTVLYEAGQRDWHRGDEPGPPRTVSPSRNLAVIPPRIALAAMPGGRIRGRTRVRPSVHVEPGGTLRISDVLASQGHVALDRGTLLHAWFERIQWLDEARPTEEVLRRIANQREAGNQLDVDRCLTQFQAILRMPQVAWTLSKRSYQPPRDLRLPTDVLAEIAAGALELEVWCERRFAIPLAGEVLSGSIDRLVLLRRGFEVLAADIIDFKTDAVDSTTDRTVFARRLTQYQSQLHDYRRAVSALYRLPPSRISARLLFLAAGRVEHVG